MEAIILHPKNKTQLSLLKNLAKEMGVLFETKEEEEIVVGYTSKGQPFTVSEYKKTIQNRIDDVRGGTAKTSTSEQVLNRILKR
jgi:metal-dependent hydrolase (beta-lactamase superfamily II)